MCGRWGGGGQGGSRREGTEAALWPCCPGQPWVSSSASFSVRQHAPQWMGRVCGRASSRVRACVCTCPVRACSVCVCMTVAERLRGRFRSQTGNESWFPHFRPAQTECEPLSLTLPQFTYLQNEEKVPFLCGCGEA